MDEEEEELRQELLEECLDCFRYRFHILYEDLNDSKVMLLTGAGSMSALKMSSACDRDLKDTRRYILYKMTPNRSVKYI